MAVGRTHIQDTLDSGRCLQERTCDNRRHQRQTVAYGQDRRNGKRAQASRDIFFKVLKPIEQRVGAKLIPEIYENVTTADQYELLEMNRISGFVNRARGTGRPTKKDRRSLDAFIGPSLEGLDVYDDGDFDYDATEGKDTDEDNEY